MTTYANLHPKYIFGLSKSCKSSNVWFVDNNTILYPAGSAVVLFNLDQKTQSFLHGVEKQKGVSCLTVAHNKMYAALGQIADEPSIAIFDLKTNKRRKTIQSADAKAKEYVSLSFTADNIHLASLTGDYVFVLYKWDRNRVMAMVKVTAGLGPVYEISTSPMDVNVMCVAGNACFRFYRFNENHLKAYGYQKGDSQHFLVHAWYKADRVIAGTSDGKLMLFERGDYRHDIPIKNVKNEITGTLAERVRNNAKQKDQTKHESSQSQALMLKTKEDSNPNRPPSNFLGEEITAIAAYGNGFAVAYGVGNVIIFEEQLVYTSSEDHYKQMYVIRIPSDTSESEDRIVKTLVVSPNEEILVASTFNCNIYSFQLSSAEIKEPEEMVFELANCSFHFGAVLSMDIAIRKSLLVTCGVDKFIRVWNFLNMTQEASREFAEDIYCVSIHPTGLFVLAGMVDKIRMYTILLNDIRELKEWPVRSCKELRFSNGGHLFAAANGNILQLYSTTSLENTCNMKGHSNKIKRITWTQDDFRVVTAGSDGAIYEWEIQSAKRSADLVERGSKLVSVVLSPDSKTHYAINSNKYIKEIQIHEGVIVKEVDLGADMVPTSIAMSRSGKILLAGFENGTIRSFRQPLTYSNEWSDYHLHCGAVTGLMCTCDEIYCISISTDNAVIFWKMTDSEGRVAKLEKDLNYSTEVLVTKNDLDERQVIINELKQKYGELKLEMDYALKRKDMAYQEEIRDLNSKFSIDIKQLNLKIDDLVKMKDKNADEYNGYLLEVAKNHKSTIENIEAHFNTKLIAEFEKFNALQNLFEDTIKEYEGKLVTLESDRDKAIEELVQYFEGKIKDKNSVLEQAFNDARTQMSESEEMTRQIEEDADQEILEVTTSYERKLRHEREMNGKLKGEAGIMRKKFQTMQKEIEEQKNEVQRLHTDISKLSNTIKSTEREVVQLQKSLVDRETANNQKEKTIIELQKNNNDLEKFKFVLEYRIKELRKIVEPKSREIIYFKQQNADMENELDATIAVRSGLQLQVSEFKNKLRMTEKDYNHEKRMRVRLQVLLERVRSHLTRCMSVLADHRALKAVVKSMYNKYGEGIQAGKASSAEQEAICELVRQKNHLEISLTSIKRKLNKDAQFTRTEQLKIMHENMLLVYEINNLRRELKMSRDKIASYETALGFNQAAHAAEAAEMRFKLQHAIEDRDEIDIQHEQIIEAKDNIIEAQMEEIGSLSTKILKVHEFVHDTARPEGMPSTAVEHIRSVLNTNSYQA